MNPTPELSIVIPLLNEEGNIELLHSRLMDTLKSIHVPYEIIFVDDGSTDNSFNKIKIISLADPHTHGISLSRNFGHQVALAAGLTYSKGQAVVTMDADLQHPPEMIAELYTVFLQGFDIVNTIRKSTEETSLLKKITSLYFYKLINKLSDVHIEPAAADFRLMSRKTVDAFLQFKEKDRFTRGLISYMGFRQAMLPYTAPARHSGKTKYTFSKMLRFALDGITSFSAKPLRISFYIGVLVSFIGLLYAIFAIVENYSGKTVAGWASILVSVLIIGGLQLISIGLVGEYLARVFKEAKGRPLFLIKDQTPNINN